MQLNHLNLGVTEIPKTVAMFEIYFGLKSAEFMPPNPKMAFLRDDAGMLLALFRVSDVNYPKIFHIGFMRESVAEVDAIHARLAEEGFQPQEAREEHGRYTFYFTAPGGFLVEVNTTHLNSR